MQNQWPTNLYLCYFVISIWKRAGPFHWTNLKPLHPRMHCIMFGWKYSVVLEKILFNHFNVFSKFLYYPLWEKGKSLHLNPHHPRMLCAKFDWNWPSGSWEEDENVRSLQTDELTMDNRQLEKFQLRWTKNDNCTLNRFQI